jgi:hypothetical protein
MLRIPFATGIASAAARPDGTYGDVTHQAGRTYFHGPRRTGDSGVPSGQFTRPSCAVLRGATRTRRPAATRRAALRVGKGGDGGCR